jgi:hypothetical protein
MSATVLSPRRGNLPIVTSGSGSNAKNTCVPVQHAHVWQLAPVDLLELGSVRRRRSVGCCDSRHREENVSIFSMEDWG